jgi:hypothetical protein
VSRRVIHLEQGLRLLRALLLAATPLTALAFYWTWPPPPNLSTSVSIHSGTSISGDGERRIHELGWYAPMWERNLKQPPVPRNVETSPQPQQPPSPLPALVATLVEPKGSYAHFSAGGRLELKGVNETVAGYRIVSIEPGRVQLEQDQRLVWLELPKPPR